MFRWAGFAAGVVLAFGTVIAVMKTLIVPRRSWPFLAASAGFPGISDRPDAPAEWAMV